MDPNATLENIRRSLKVIEDAVTVAPMDLDRRMSFVKTYTEDLSASVDALAGWLESGGFPPDDWQS